MPHTTSITIIKLLFPFKHTLHGQVNSKSLCEPKGSGEGEVQVLQHQQLVEGCNLWQALLQQVHQMQTTSERVVIG